MFAHETNLILITASSALTSTRWVNSSSPTALNVVLETIQNRVAANRLAGRYTWVFVDEVNFFFKYYLLPQFFSSAGRVFAEGAAMTAATQNIEECLRSETARLMLANSEFFDPAQSGGNRPGRTGEVASYFGDADESCDECGGRTRPHADQQFHHPLCSMNFPRWRPLSPDDHNAGGQMSIVEIRLKSRHIKGVYQIAGI